MGKIQIFLTFDDGPNEPYTGEVLDILASYNVPGTFFVCGKNVERSPHTIRRLYEAGHAVGNHAYSHSWSMTGRLGLLQEFRQTEKLLRAIGGREVPLVRAPWGLMTGAVKKELLTGGYKIYNWNITAYDWWRLPAGYVARRVIDRARPGAIVLLHDGGKTQANVNRSATVKALPEIIETLRSRNYEFSRLS